MTPQREKEIKGEAFERIDEIDHSKFECVDDFKEAVTAVFITLMKEELERQREGISTEIGKLNRQMADGDYSFDFRKGFYEALWQVVNLDILLPSDVGELEDIELSTPKPEKHE